jgi:hypothetical protein
VKNKSLKDGVELVTNLGRIGVAVAMLALAVLGGGCSGNSNNVEFVVPTRTPTPAVTSTPTPAITSTPTPAVTTTATPTPSGPTSTPTAVVPAALWVENALANSVTEFKGATLTTPGPSVPAAAVTNMSADLKTDPAGITFDSSGNQWVSVCGSATNHGSITEFNSAAVKALATNPTPPANVVLSDDGTGKLVNCPWSMTFDPGNLWAANSNENGFTAQGFVTEYLAAQLTVTGQPTPNFTLTDPTQFVSPTGVVFDSTGDLFVSDFGPTQSPFPAGTGSGAVWVFKAATIAGLTGTKTIVADAKLSDATTMAPVNGAFDSIGNLWVADCEAHSTGEIYMFPKAVLTTGSTSATTIFQSTSITTTNGAEDTIDCPGGIAFDASGNLWYTNFSSLKVDGAVGEFTAAQLLTALGTTSAPTPTIFLDGMPGGANFDGPIGLIFGPQV